MNLLFAAAPNCGQRRDTATRKIRTDDRGDADIPHRMSEDSHACLCFFGVVHADRTLQLRRGIVPSTLDMLTGQRRSWHAGAISNHRARSSKVERRSPKPQAAVRFRPGSPIHAGVAQLVERLLCKQRVQGSIPCDGTNFPSVAKRKCSRILLGTNAGSNPAGRSNFDVIGTFAACSESSVRGGYYRVTRCIASSLGLKHRFANGVHLVRHTVSGGPIDGVPARTAEGTRPVDPASHPFKKQNSIAASRRMLLEGKRRQGATLLAALDSPHWQCQHCARLMPMGTTRCESCGRVFAGPSNGFTRPPRLLPRPLQPPAKHCAAAFFSVGP